MWIDFIIVIKDNLHLSTLRHCSWQKMQESSSYLGSLAAQQIGSILLVVAQIQGVKVRTTQATVIGIFAGVCDNVNDP